LKKNGVCAACGADRRIRHNLPRTTEQQEHIENVLKLKIVDARMEAARLRRHVEDLSKRNSNLMHEIRIALGDFQN
jgi:hypothetical protein